MKELKCVCGGSVTVGVDDDRDVERAIAAEDFEKAESELRKARVDGALTTAAIQPFVITAAKAKAKLDALSLPCVTAKCDNCNIVIHESDEERAAAILLRAVDKFSKLADCCKTEANLEERRDKYWGLYFRCKECGIHHYK